MDEKRILKECEYRYCSNRVKEKNRRCCSYECAARMRHLNGDYNKKKVEQIHRAIRKNRLNRLISMIDKIYPGKRSFTVDELDPIISRIKKNSYTTGYNRGSYIMKIKLDELRAK